MYMILQEQPYFPEDNPTIKMDYNQIQDNEISQHYKQQDNSFFTESTDFFETFIEWSDLPINDDLLRGIYAYGFEKPSPIQQKSILSIIKGRDILAQACSGTGKTGSFVIGALANIDVSIKETQVIIVTPTRELTRQIYDVIEGLSIMMPELKKAILVGGTFIRDDIDYFKNNTPHIIVACPGRLFDFIQRDLVFIKDIKTIILDETDELLSYGFKDQMFNIFKKISPSTQIALFSATFSEANGKIISTILKDPIKIVVKPDDLSLEGISQFYVAIENDKQKYEVIKDLYESLVISQTIIFCNSVERVEELHKALQADNYPVCSVHSNLTKEERDEAFNEFKKGKYRVMVSSNVTARGIDLQQISVVINFDIPKCKSVFLHRVGRTARYGRKGVAINLITKRDIIKIREFESHYSMQIKELPTDFNKYM